MRSLSAILASATLAHLPYGRGLPAVACAAHCEPILSSLPAILGLRDISTSLYGTQYCAA